MNPHSNYYLSFNVGYPNAYDRAHGYTGGNIMVHGVCSSAGCFSMTDQQIAEIYAIAREAFAGGQQSIQMQSYPFHMTPMNIALYRFDPNIAFWKELEVGNDNFEVTKKDVAVGVCNDHYVFNAEPANGQPFDPTGPCPALKRDQAVALAVAAREKSDDAKVAELVAEGVKPIHTIYADGGQNRVFTARHEQDVSRPEALAEGSLNVPVTGYRKRNRAQLLAAEKQAEAAAAAAESKAKAAHAFAYADASQRAAPQQRPAQAPSNGFGLPGLTHLFAAKPSAPPVAAVPQTMPEQPQLATAPVPRAVPQLAKHRLIEEARKPEHPKAEHGKSEHAKLAHARPAQTKPVPSKEAKAAKSKTDTAKAAPSDQAKAADLPPIYGTMSALPPSFSAAAGATDH